jgi:hypothetical protein
MPEKVQRPSIGIPPLTRPQYERIELATSELQEFWRIVLRSSDADWATMRIWSHILFYNTPRGL